MLAIAISSSSTFAFVQPSSSVAPSRHRNRDATVPSSPRSHGGGTGGGRTNALSDFLAFDATTTNAPLASSAISDALSSASSSFASSTDLLLSFSDQGQNLAGTFFQLSLLPYLLFLYVLGFRGNRTPDLGNFGFQYLLLFVLGTIPSGIVTKGAYGLNLANVDWIHGGAEALLTITNVLIVSSML